MKKYLTMWKTWAGIAILLMIALFIKNDIFLAILPYGIFLICPLMMVLMMRNHKH